MKLSDLSETQIRNFSLRVEMTKGCWIWHGHISREGYGKLALIYAHTIAFLLSGGLIPDSYELDHLCRNRACCNPSHLEAVSHRENCLRGCSPTATNASRTHCPKGHPYSGDNLYLDDGKRKCHACLILRWRIKSRNRPRKTDRRMRPELLRLLK